jgi:hypothetical protein
VAITTASGNDSGDVGLHGVVDYDNQVLTKDDLNNANIDILSVMKAQLLPGILAGGTMTSLGMGDARISSGTTYYAEMFWTIGTTTVVSVNGTEGAVTYIWGCSDGQIRTTTTTTPPTNFTTTTACIIAKCTTTGGVSVFDSSAQQWARYANPTTREVRDGILTISPTSMKVGGGAGLTKILSGTATLNFGSVAAQSYADLTITVTGASDGDTVALGVPNASVPAGGAFTAWVSASSTVTVRFHNYTSGSIDPASGTFRATVFQF